MSELWEGCPNLGHTTLPVHEKDGFGFVQSGFMNHAVESNHPDGTFTPRAPCTQHGKYNFS